MGGVLDARVYRRGQAPEIHKENTKSFIKTPHNLCGSHPSQQPLHGG